MTSVQLVSNQIGDVGNDCALHQFGEFNKYSVLGVRQVVLGLRVSPLGGLRMLASQCPVDMQVSNPAYQASWRPIFVRWFGRDHLFTLISRSPVISKKTVHCLLHTAHYAIISIHPNSGSFCMTGVLAVGGESLAGFTGKASFVALMKANQIRQQEIHTEMLYLIQQSKIDGSPLNLQKHFRSSLNWNLRWRIRRGTRQDHVLWSNIEVDLAKLPIPVQQHYERIRWCNIHLGHQQARNPPGLLESE